MVLCIFCLPPASLGADKAPLTDDDRLRWSKEFLTLYQGAGNWRELFAALPVSPAEAKFLDAKIKHHALPRLRFDGEDFHVGKNDFRILDLRNRDFRLNGRVIHLPPRASVVEIAKAFAKHRPASHAWNSFLLELPSAEAGDGFNPNLISSTELLWSDWTRVADHELSWVVVASDRLAPILPLVLLTDYALTKAEAYATPSCDQQIAKLQKLLNDQYIALAEVDCGKSYRGNDRTLGFWRASGKKVVKETYYCDFRFGAAEYDEPEGEDGAKKNKTAYLFDYDSLVQVRALKQVNNHEKRMDSASGTPEFAEYQKQIEPVRKALFYIGTNHTCDRCATELATLSLGSAPKELLTKAGGAVPASSVNGHGANSPKHVPGER